MNKRVIIIFTLLLTVYGAYQWWDRSRDPVFEAPLMQVDAGQLLSIDIDPPGDEEPFSLLHIDGSWIASREPLNVRANKAAVERLVQVLNGLRTADLLSQHSRHWERYGVAEGQGLKISLQYNDKRQEAILLSLFPQVRTHPDSLVYARLDGQKDVYGIRARQVEGLPMYLADFRDAQFVSLPGASPAAFRLVWPDTISCFHTLEGGWHCNGVAVDSMALDAYFEHIKQLSGAVFANDFDELQAGRLPRRQLIVYPGNATDSIILNCYIDSLRLWPYVLQGSQYPYHWLASDSAGLYKQVFGQLDSLLTPHLSNTPNKVMK